MTEKRPALTPKIAQNDNRPPSFFRERSAARMKKMMKMKKMTNYFAASPSGKMALFTKKKTIMEMPPLSTVVPML